MMEKSLGGNLRPDAGHVADSDAENRKQLSRHQTLLLSQTACTARSSVLASPISLEIRGEYATGPDEGFLDNFELQRSE